MKTCCDEYRHPAPAERADLFHWSNALDPRDYVRATYVVTSLHDGEATAIALAMEQSAATIAIAG